MIRIPVSQYPLPGALRGKAGLHVADGRHSGDRQWVECYAQLVGTVLSLWDSAALDAAGGEEVPATFINLADASIKMVRALASQDCQA